ncbi:MAG: UvrB/UvrC motif-containing protein [Ruminococcus sp.]|uniref:UvrB/UvrC motif-containing protein n=1 Tax=Ruminococcus sp. TaxID=41978 RepID=UPI002873E9DA|nr:UvrB/UvrC motif-containing protein [Ruminococcus sp.]MBQ3284354.1 UvrB/UvrC motif-containing protein [Ruminococcus sp.]
MLCQHCKKHEATTVVKTMINGKYAEYRLCPECAHELGYDSMFTDFTSDFGGLFSSFFSNALPAISGATHCDTCGSTINDIRRTGKVGCADCYDTFFSELMPTIRSVHGNTEHKGKRPGAIEYTVNEEEEGSAENKIESLRAELKKAIENENFERAAQLRDEIKEMEG